MKLSVTDDRTRTTRILDEYESVIIGRYPISGQMARIEIGGGQAFDFLSNHAVTIHNNDDRILVDNRQRPANGRVLVTVGSEWKLVHPDNPKPVHPLPTDTLVKIQLFGNPGGELLIHIKAKGMPLKSLGPETKDANANGAVLQDWVLAINAIECNRRAGGKMTANAAKKYFLRYKNVPGSDTRLFEAAYRTAGEFITGDAECGQAFLLSRASSVINERLVKQLTDMTGT